MLAEELGMRPLQAHCHLGLGRLYPQTGRRPGPHRPGRRHRPVPRHGYDLLAAPGRSRAGTGRGAVMDDGIILTAGLVLLQQETSDQHYGGIA